ncbi:MAG: site-specific integrase [Brevundimonas sp.]|nr:MAG: site-specific integrase [Brevundimonas sp.]
MAREINRLNWKQVAGLKEPGLHADGQGLYLRIDETGSRRWVLIFQYGGRRREMGLGSAEGQKLAEVRAKCDEARVLIKAGLDPIAERKKANAPAADTRFSAVASSLIDDLEEGWRSAKQRGQWEASLKQHAPKIWDADVRAVDTEMVLTALRPIWTKKPETASRVRSRIERVLSAAKARGLREGENPAIWRGHLDQLLTKAKRQKGHHAAMAYADVPSFITRLRDRSSISAKALEFTIFTAARSGEVRGAMWEEVDGDVWIIPAERMKAEREHRVPLNDGARRVLDGIPTDIREGLIFPGLKGALTDMALAMVMRKMDVTDATPHGFRSAFKDWAMDCTSFADEISEEALAHTVGSAVRRAYRRGSAMEKRRLLMKAWADHCLGRSGQVIQMKDRA